MTSAAREVDLDDPFFADITEVFRKHPEAAKHYGLTSFELERRLGVDFDSQHGVSWIEDGRIITDYRDHETARGDVHVLGRICREWRWEGSEKVCVSSMEKPL